MLPGWRIFCKGIPEPYLCEPVLRISQSVMWEGRGADPELVPILDLSEGNKQGMLEWHEDKVIRFSSIERVAVVVLVR